MATPKWRNETWLRTLLTDASLTETDANVLANWARAACEIRPVLFVGAGWSANALRLSHRKAMTWSELSSRLRQDLTLEDSNGNVDPLWLAELYRQQHGVAALMSVLEQAVPDRELLPGSLHKVLTGFHWHSVLTTNYDTLLERAFEPDVRVRVCVDDGDLTRSARQDELELVHLHGVLTRPDTVVLAFEDYRQYPAKHPGMVAKVRQLFLQHPVLFIGFGVTDPNFLQWSGWLSDVVGDMANPWVSLTHGPPPPLPQRAYWGKRLRFVRLPGSQAADREKQIASLFDILSEALQSRDRRTRELVTKRLRAARSSTDVVTELTTLLETLEQREGIDTDLDDFTRMAFDTAASHILDLSTPVASAFASPAGVEGTDGVAAAAGPKTARSPDECRHRLAQAFGSALWVRFKHLLAQYITGPRWHFTYRASDGLAASPFSAVFDIDAKDNPSRLERASRQLRGDEPLELPNRPATPREYRLLGFNAYQSWDHMAAAGHYAKAAELSRQMNEPLRVELFTRQSLASCLAVTRKAEELAAVKKQLERGYQALARMPYEESDQRTKDEELRALRRLTNELMDRLHDGPGKITFTADWHTPEAKLIRLESEWFAPPVVAEAAGTFGILQWLDRDWISASKTLVRYSDERLAGLANVDVTEGRLEAAEAQKLGDDLIKPARWPGEYLSKSETLVALLPVLSPAQLERIGGFMDAARRAVPVDRAVTRGTSRLFGGVARAIVEKLEQSRWRWLRGEAAITAIQDWRQSMTLVLDEDLRKSHWIQLPHLPWMQWVRAGLDKTAVAAFLVQLTQASRPASELQPDWEASYAAGFILNLAERGAVDLSTNATLRARLGKLIRMTGLPERLKLEAGLARAQGNRKRALEVVSRALARVANSNAQDKCYALDVAVAGGGERVRSSV